MSLEAEVLTSALSLALRCVSEGGSAALLPASVQPASPAAARSAATEAVPSNASLLAGVIICRSYWA